MSLNRTNSDVNVNISGKNISKEELQNLLQKLQANLEVVKGNLSAVQINQDNAKLFLGNVVKNLFKKAQAKVISTLTPNVVRTSSEEQEARLITTKIYNLIRSSSKEIRNALPPIEIMADSFPQIYASDDKNMIRIVYKEKTLLNLDLTKIKNKVNPPTKISE